MTGTPDQAPRGTSAMYCRTCRRPLHRRTSPTGVDTFVHKTDLRGLASDHPAEPVPVEQVMDPVTECDFCSQPDPVWLYECADQHTDARIVTARTVDLRDYHRRHHAARTRSIATTPALVQRWGKRWSACQGCAVLIEQRDLYGLISWVTEAVPAKYTRGKRLPRVRADLHATYTTVLATLAPERGRIIPDHPLGVGNRLGPLHRPRAHHRPQAQPDDQPAAQQP
jgi:hypothetical protein